MVTLTEKQLERMLAELREYKKNEGGLNSRDGYIQSSGTLDYAYVEIHADGGALERNFFIDENGEDGTGR